jgi:hypothetical protein
MARKQDPIVGPDVANETQLRPTAPVRSIDEFLAFLQQIEELFGPTKRAQLPTTGEHFKL